MHNTSKTNSYIKDNYQLTVFLIFNKNKTVRTFIYLSLVWLARGLTQRRLNSTINVICIEHKRFVLVGNQEYLLEM